MGCRIKDRITIRMEEYKMKRFFVGIFSVFLVLAVIVMLAGRYAVNANGGEFDWNNIVPDAVTAFFARIGEHDAPTGMRHKDVHPTEKATEDVITEGNKPAKNQRKSGIDPDFKAAMDAYESFYAEYCSLLRNYNANPTI